MQLGFWGAIERKNLTKGFRIEKRFWVLLARIVILSGDVKVIELHDSSIFQT